MTKQISSVSTTYAKSLIEVFKGKIDLENIKNQLFDLVKTIKESSELTVVIENSSISIQVKNSIIDSIFGTKFDKELINFLKILVSKHRISELENIYNAYCKILDELSNITKVKIISAIDLTKETQEMILQTLQNKLKTSIIPSWETDESIIAGLIFKFNDYEVDSSIDTKLKNMSKNILR